MTEQPPSAERPAPEPVHLTLRQQGVMRRALLRSTRPAPEGPQQFGDDYTERALTVARDAIEGVPSHLLPYRINSEEIAQAIAPYIADALSEIAEMLK